LWGNSVGIPWVPFLGLLHLDLPLPKWVVVAAQAFINPTIVFTDFVIASCHQPYLLSLIFVFLLLWFDL